VPIWCRVAGARAAGADGVVHHYRHEFERAVGVAATHRGVPQTNTLLLNNLTAVPLTGITATILGAPSDVNVQVSVPSSLPGNGAVQTTISWRRPAPRPAGAVLHPIYQRARGVGDVALHRHDVAADRAIVGTDSGIAYGDDD
jgi:hypothetical protein